MIRAIVSAVGLLVGFIVVLWLAYGGSDAPNPTGSPTPSEAVAAQTRTQSPTPMPTPTVEPIHGLPTRKLVVGDEVPFPDDVALIFETGCWQCDGAASGLVRAYRDPSGALRSEPLASAQKLGLSDGLPGPAAGRYISSYVIAPDASDIWVAICVLGDCGVLGDAKADAQVDLFRSTDGGVTWASQGSLPPGDFLANVMPDQQVAVVRYGVTSPDAAVLGVPPTYYLYPSGQPLISPLGEGSPAATPVRLGSRVLWLTYAGRLLQPDGREFASFQPDGYISADSFVPDSVGRIVLPWVLYSYREIGGYYLALTDVNGFVIRNYRTQHQLLPGAALGKAGFAGTLIVQESGSLQRPQPAIVNTERETIHPISLEDIAGVLPPGRNLVVAAQRGPLARVAGTDSCLNIRAEPSLDGIAQRCVADGVLLQLEPPPYCRFVSGWGCVRTADNTYGYASNSFLDREPFVDYCDVDQIRAEPAGWENEPMGAIVLSNAGQAPCRLGAFPSVSLLNEAGEQLYWPTTNCLNSGSCDSISSEVLASADGASDGRTSLTLDFHWSTAPQEVPCHVADASVGLIRLDFQSAGSIDVPVAVTFPSGCDRITVSWSYFP